MEPSFSAVWSRVTGSPASEDEVLRLRRWCRDASEAAGAFSAMARRVGDPVVRDTLRSAARDEERQLHALSALYYLRSGERAAPAPRTDSGRSLLEFLRDRYQQALERAESFDKGAAGARPDTAALCRELSEEERRRANQLRRLVERLL